MAVGATDVLEIGVLAAGAEHLLDADNPFRRGRLRPDEVRLERLHAGDHEERRGVFGRRDQRVRGHAEMAALLVEALETLTQLGGCTHRKQCTAALTERYALLVDALELLREVRLAARGGLLARRDRAAQVASRAQRREPVRDAG